MPKRRHTGRALSQPQPQVLEQQVRLSAYSGPLPPPDMLRAFEDRLPGSGQLILQVFKDEGEHRRTLERMALDGDLEDRKADRAEASRGQRYGLFIAVLGLLLSGAVSIFGPSPQAVWAGSALGGVTLLGLVTVFIAGRRAKRADDGNPDPGKK